ncbi:hypothetical protein CEXT_353151 [Caerostris extrusa]|uniref:Uncharacterized protein n=1 Tax=Caerostris extrusa TaxID=172846 RepID=A0AAV4XC01_CAEEX|nr:hypothetical protein CEXT_353151 [Caerostris extrusa]
MEKGLIVESPQPLHFSSFKPYSQHCPNTYSGRLAAQQKPPQRLIEVFVEKQERSINTQIMERDSCSASQPCDLIRILSLYLAGKAAPVARESSLTPPSQNPKGRL